MYTIMKPVGGLIALVVIIIVGRYIRAKRIEYTKIEGQRYIEREEMDEPLIGRRENLYEE